MVEFLPCVFSSGRPWSVARVNGHIRQEPVNVRWLVGHGEQVQYMKSGASRVLEVGDLCKVMAYSIRLANTTKTPVVLISDDIRGFFAFVGPPSNWTSRLHGCRLGLSDFTGRILAAMRQVAAPVGGVACSADARTQLEAPAWSYHHFFTMDFMVLDPPLNFPVEFHPDVQHKLDYNIIASALAAIGAVCRMNRFAVDAPHYTAGGAGPGDARRKSDHRACRWLQRRWGTKAIHLNPKREAQIILRGHQLLERGAMRLPELHTELYAATVPTKLSAKDTKVALAAGGASTKAWEVPGPVQRVTPSRPILENCLV